MNKLEAHIGLAIGQGIIPQPATDFEKNSLLAMHDFSFTEWLYKNNFIQRNNVTQVQYDQVCTYVNFLKYMNEFNRGQRSLWKSAEKEIRKNQKAAGIKVESRATTFFKKHYQFWVPVLISVATILFPSPFEKEIEEEPSFIQLQTSMKQMNSRIDSVIHLKEGQTTEQLKLAITGLNQLAEAANRKQREDSIRAAKVKVKTKDK